MNPTIASFIELAFQGITVAGVITIVVFVVKIAIRWGEISTLVKHAIDDVKSVANTVKDIHYALRSELNSHGERLNELERSVGKLEGKNWD